MTFTVLYYTCLSYDAHQIEVSIMYIWYAPIRPDLRHLPWFGHYPPDWTLRGWRAGHSIHSRYHPILSPLISDRYQLNPKKKSPLVNWRPEVTYRDINQRWMASSDSQSDRLNYSHRGGKTPLAHMAPYSCVVLAPHRSWPLPNHGGGIGFTFPPSTAHTGATVKVHYMGSTLPTDL